MAGGNRQPLTSLPTQTTLGSTNTISSLLLALLFLYLVLSSCQERYTPSHNPCLPLGSPPPLLAFPTEYLPTPPTGSCTALDSWQIWQEFAFTLYNDLKLYLTVFFKSADTSQNKLWES